MTRADLHSKLRLAVISHRDQVLAVVIETTGDFSDIKGAIGETQLDMDLFEGVRDALPPLPASNSYLTTPSLLCYLIGERSHERSP